jgi:hypothetical protein
MKWPGLIKIIGVDAYKSLRIHNATFIHDWSGLIMGLLVIIHLILHGKWLVVVTKSFFKKKQENKER